MKLCDLIETAEEALEVILPVDDVGEMQRHFGDYTTLHSWIDFYKSCSILTV
jgi:hypothetical protein